jgi:hypothetical protein
MDRCMRRPTVVLWSAIWAAAALACGGATEQELVTPSGGGRCQMTLAVPPFPFTGATVTAQLTAARDCIWSAQTADPWLQLAPTSGQGTSDLTLTAAENPMGRNRLATININDQQFSVAQNAAPCRFEVAPPSLAMGHQGGRARLDLSTLEGCTWTTHSSQPWMRVVSASGGESSGALELAVDSNLGPERSALLAVATLVVAVTQNAGPNDISACRFSLDPGGRTIPAAGGTGSFTVSTRPACSWSVASSQPWVTILSSGNPIGPETVFYRVDPNPSPTVRSAAITAGTRQHVIRQEAAPRP